MCPYMCPLNGHIPPILPVVNSRAPKGLPLKVMIPHGPQHPATAIPLPRGTASIVVSLKSMVVIFMVLGRQAKVVVGIVGLVVAIVLMPIPAFRPQPLLARPKPSASAAPIPRGGLGPHPRGAWPSSRHPQNGTFGST